VAGIAACGGRSESKQPAANAPSTVSNTAPAASNSNGDVRQGDGDADDVRAANLAVSNKSGPDKEGSADRDDLRSGNRSNANADREGKHHDADDRGKKESDKDNDDR
jgi:hypothetical protein